VKLLNAKPLLPDLEAFTDAGGYITVKFLTNPVPPSSTYDIRLENSILRPIQPTEEEILEKQAAKENYERDPERNPPPDDTIDYEFYLTETPAQALNFKRKFDVLDPEREEQDLYPRRSAELGGFFRFKRVRAYESASVIGSVTEKYDEEVLIATSDGSDGVRQRAAYYYPIIQRASIRPQRTKNIRKNKNGYNKRDAEANYTDYVDMRVEDPTDEMKAVRAVFKDHPYGQVDQGEEDVEENGEQSRRQSAKSSTPAGRDEDDDQKSD
jgi:RNA polymerase II-associated factor 1